MSWTGGATLVFLAAVCHALYFVLQKPILKVIDSGSAATFMIVAGGLCLLPWLPQGLSEMARADSQANFAVIFLGVFPAALGYFTWSFAQAHFGASRAANFLYLVPPTASIIAYVWTGEVPSAITLIGGATAIAGVILVNIMGRRPQIMKV